MYLRPQLCSDFDSNYMYVSTFALAHTVDGLAVFNVFHIVSCAIEPEVLSFFFFLNTHKLLLILPFYIAFVLCS